MSNVNKNDGSTKEVKYSMCEGYNIFMGGVDLCDQYRKVLSCSRKSIKWYMSLVWFFIDVCVINAFILEKKSQTSPKRTQKKFRIDLANWYMYLFMLQGSQVVEVIHILFQFVLWTVTFLNS